MQLTSDLLLLNAFFIIVGFYLLIKGSDWFVDSSSFIARHYNISEIIIGLTIVSIGTSLPELAANIYASIMGESSISLGNVVGSNIANICLVLGIGGLITGKIFINKSVLNRDGLLMIFTFILLLILSITNSTESSNGGAGFLGRIDGILFIIVFFVYLFILIRSVAGGKGEIEEEDHHKMFKSMFTAISCLFLGLIFIFIGAKVLVDNVVWCAVKFNIPQSVIAATVVAFGTSVPELTVTVTGAMKGKHDIAVGNIIGSCIFNITLVLGISLVIRPINVDSSMIWIIMPIMIISGILTLLMVWRSKCLNRLKSFVLLALYLLFILYSLAHVFGA
jgi:cation:H+ antiporter